MAGRSASDAAVKKSQSPPGRGAWIKIGRSMSGIDRRAVVVVCSWSECGAVSRESAIVVRSKVELRTGNRRCGDRRGHRIASVETRSSRCERNARRRAARSGWSCRPCRLCRTLRKACQTQRVALGCFSPVQYWIHMSWRRIAKSMRLLFTAVLR